MFRTRQKKHIRDRFEEDAIFRTRQKKHIRDRYEEDATFRTRQKKHIRDRYEEDAMFRKMQRALRIRRKYRQIVPHRPQPLIDPVMEAAIAAFRESIRHGPTYICTVCNRTMFPNQVKECKRQKYVYIRKSCRSMLDRKLCSLL